MDKIIIEVISEKVGSKEHSEIVNMIRKIIEECKFRNVRVFEREVFDETVTIKYGVIPAPSIAINGVLMVIGRKPLEKEIKDLILRAKMVNL